MADNSQREQELLDSLEILQALRQTLLTEPGNRDEILAYIEMLHNTLPSEETLTRELKPPSGKRKTRRGRSK